MNDNRNIITHMRTDPNAPKHAAIGAAASGVGVICALLFGGVATVAPLLLPLLAGIGIEIVQRLQGGTNTNREAMLDALTTWLWPLYYIKGRGSGHER